MPPLSTPPQPSLSLPLSPAASSPQSARSAGRLRALALVYLSGLAQGMALTTFAAAGNLLRSPDAHGLSAGRYGTLFLVMFAVAMPAAAGAGPITRRLGIRGLHLGGLGANLTAMLGLAATQLLIGAPAAAFAGLLLAIAALGLGFGSTLTALNDQAARLFPTRTAAAVTALHTLLGVGTALPSLLLPLFEDRGAWWLFPLSIAALLAALLIGGLAGGPRDDVGGSAARAADVSGDALAGPGAPSRRRLAALAMAPALYGMCEAMLANWGPVFLHDERGLSQRVAGLALSAFWLSVTAGRLITVVASIWIPPRHLYRVLPALIAVALLAAPRVSGPGGALVVFALAGLGCSAFLPLTISLAGAQAGPAAASVSGVLFAAFLAGSGLGSFGVGLLRDRQISLGSLYAVAALAAAAAGLFGWTVVSRRPPLDQGP
jgi:MFS transporter, FHS family, glucose/mannose:H+ symporter